MNTTDVGTHLMEIFGAEASQRFHLLPEEMIHLLRPLNPDEGILLSGCQTEETSSDVSEDDGKAFGAFSNAVQEVFQQCTRPLTNRELVARVREVLAAQQFEQHPCLYCGDENADEAFLCEFVASSV